MKKSEKDGMEMKQISHSKIFIKTILLFAKELFNFYVGMLNKVK
jgi:hypothetical protein